MFFDNDYFNTADGKENQILLEIDKNVCKDDYCPIVAENSSY